MTIEAKIKMQVGELVVQNLALSQKVEDLQAELTALKPVDSKDAAKSRQTRG